MTTPYRADNVGSLLRPPELLAARTAHGEGRLPLDALRELEDQAILDALAMQRQVGIDVATDGELRRRSWMTGLAEAVEGFVPDRVTLHWRGPGGGTEEGTARIANGRLRQQRHLAEHELPFLKRHAAGPYKITVPCASNYLLASYRPGLTDQHYASRDEFLQDLTAIIRGEVEWLIAQGVPYVQLDQPNYPRFVDEQARAQMRQAGMDPDATFAAALAADAASVAGLARPGLTLGMHVCRGNSRSRWYAEGGYEPIAERIFNDLDVDTYLLEYDSDRAGGFEPLRFLPAGKTVVLGLVTTKEPHLESQDELLRRIDEASKYAPIANLALSPQCGFASVMEGNLLTLDDQRRKLELVVDTARKVWG
jgi:5-methyltetrahydropteroyltriglutamate--homocysteine methyltransferase